MSPVFPRSVPWSQPGSQEGFTREINEMRNMESPSSPRQELRIKMQILTVSDNFVGLKGKLSIMFSGEGIESSGTFPIKYEHGNCNLIYG